MSQPQISVVIPTYQRAHTIHPAIDSVLGQTVPVTEVIIVDDGSTDDTEAVLRERYGDRIIYLRQENAGPSAARNRGIAAARSPWIAFLDSDDVWHPRKIEQQAYALRDPTVVVCATNFDFIDAPEENQFEAIGLDLEDELTAVSHPLELMARFRGSGILLSGAICRKSALERIGLFDESMRIAEDTKLFFQLAREGRFALFRSPLFSRSRDTAGGQLTESGDSSWHRIHAEASIAILRDALRAATDESGEARRRLERLLGYFLSKQATFHARDGAHRDARRTARESLALSRRGRPAVRALLGLLSPRWIA